MATVLAKVLGMVLASLAMASAATSSTSREEPGLIQVQKSSFLTRKISSLEHAEELVVHLRQMAMVKATEGRNGSVQRNYTVFRLDENASEATLQIINDSMESFLEQVNTSFHNDLREIELLIQNAEGCNQDLFNETAALNLNVTSVNASVVAAENQHDLCRIDQNATYNENVTAFNALKSKVGSQLQRIDLDESQVPEVRCMRNYLRPSSPSFTGDYTDPSQYPDAVFCAEEIKTWSTSFSSQLRGRFTNYTSADQTHADKINDCNTLQREYEESFCSYRSDLIRVCGELDRCFAHAQALYTATSALILESNETRFRSFLVAKKVVCYINVLLRNLTIAAIYECDRKQIDTSELNFTFPSLPAKESCTVNLTSVAPCADEWIQDKYTNKFWYVPGAVQNTQCQPCAVATTSTTTTTTTTSQESAGRIYTMAAATRGLCATIPITPVSNLNHVKCVGAPPRVLGGNSEFVPLGTNRTALEVFGFGTTTSLCVKLDNSSFKCWGNNNEGQLGLGDTRVRGGNDDTMGDRLPVLNLGSNLTILKVVNGNKHTCALFDNGKVKCWGSNIDGQLGAPNTGLQLGDNQGEMGDNLDFVYFGPDASEVVDVMVGRDTSCAIFKNTSLACWGSQGYGGGMLGRGISGNSPEPKVVDLGVGHHAIQLAMGNGHICALLNTSKVKCWGSNQRGEVGNGNSPHPIGDGPNEMGQNLEDVPVGNAIQIAGGWEHTCVILETHKVTCWGNNQFGQSLPGSSGNVEVPVGVVQDGSGQDVTAMELAIGNTFSCARLSNQTIYCWGRSTLANDVVNKYNSLN